MRDTHAALDGITLPESDIFWDNYLPPNGWDCRCTVVQVLREDFPLSDSEEAIRRGAESTNTPKLQMFRFNAGKTLELFPPKHPYLPKGCGGCPQRTSLKLATPADKGLPMCKACGEVAKQCLKQQQQHINEWKKRKIPEVGGFNIKGENFYWGNMLITRGSINETMSHTRNIAVRNSLLGIEQRAVAWRYIGWRPCEEGKHPEAAYFMYYEVEIGGKTYYANVKAHKVFKSEVLYCIREKCKLNQLRHDVPPNFYE